MKRSLPEGWIIVEGRLVPESEQGRVLLCSLAGCGDRNLAAGIASDRVIAEGIEVPPPEVRVLDPWPDTRYLARARDGRLLDLTQLVLADRGAR